MLGGDQARLRLAYSVLFSLPGAPMLFYGEEIGMGENLDLPGRLAVRSPMQWTDYGHGGFSTAPPDKHVRPLVTEGDFSYEQVNVRAQRGDPDSLLNWMAGLIRTRRECGEIGSGQRSKLKIDGGGEAVLGLRYDAADCAILILNNLSGKRCDVTLDLSEAETATATDLFGDRRYDPLDPANPHMRLNPYGYRWLRIGGVY
jgi:maltose alpha-D-glucosyltransferase/alpha-amylase